MLTQFEDPTPQIRGIKKQLVKYTRADGVPLSATLYLPANYQEGQRLPLLVWAYPWNSTTRIRLDKSRPHQSLYTHDQHLAPLTAHPGVRDHG